MWKKISNEDLQFSFEIEKTELTDIESGILKLSVGIELLKYELSYEDTNFSTAIGQLNLAAWDFNTTSFRIANSLRLLIHNVESNKNAIQDLVEFRMEMINSYVNKI